MGHGELIRKLKNMVRNVYFSPDIQCTFIYCPVINTEEPYSFGSEFNKKASYEYSKMTADERRNLTEKECAEVGIVSTGESPC